MQSRFICSLTVASIVHVHFPNFEGKHEYHKGQRNNNDHSGQLSFRFVNPRTLCKARMFSAPKAYQNSRTQANNQQKWNQWIHDQGSIQICCDKPGFHIVTHTVTIVFKTRKCNQWYVKYHNHKEQYATINPGSLGSAFDFC